MPRPSSPLSWASPSSSASTHSRRNPSPPPRLARCGRTRRTPHAHGTYYLLLTTYHSLLTTYYLPLTTGYRCTALYTRARRLRSRCSAPASRSSSTPTSRTSRRAARPPHGPAPTAAHLVQPPPTRCHLRAWSRQCATQRTTPCVHCHMPRPASTATCHALRPLPHAMPCDMPCTALGARQAARQVRPQV